MRGNGQNLSLTSVDKHMTSILKTGQWKNQMKNNVWPSAFNMEPEESLKHPTNTLFLHYIY